MTNKELLENGYTRYSPSPYKEYVTDVFQKSVRDEDNNIKYFITIDRVDFSKLNETEKPRYEATVQLTHKQTGEVVNIDCLSGWKMNELEKFINQLFDTGWFSKYDEVY